MVLDFNADEIFEMAEQIERNGAQFYRNMAQKTKYPSASKFLLDFAAMEEQHEKIFASMRSELSAREKEPIVFDPEGVGTEYLRALADMRVFDKNADKEFVLPEGLTEKEKTEKILWAAMGIEKESIVFYVGMKEYVPENLGKGKIDGIIKEEMKHIRALGNRLSSLVE
jgi:rubrerythrin